MNISAQGRIRYSYKNFLHYFNLPHKLAEEICPMLFYECEYNVSNCVLQIFKTQ